MFINFQEPEFSFTAKTSEINSVLNKGFVEESETADEDEITDKDEL